MASWKIITGSIVALLGLAVIVAAGIGEFRPQWDPLGSRTAIGAPVRPSSYADVKSDDIVVAAGEVDVEGGTVPLAPVIGGTVTALPAQEGAAVKSGDPIVVFDSRVAELEVEQASAAVAAAKVELQQAKQAAELHRFKLEQLRQAVIAAESKMEAAQRHTSKLEALLPQKAVDEETFLGARDQLTQLQAALKSAREQLAEAEHIDPQLQVKAAETALTAAEAKLNAAKELLAKHTLRAPADGQLLRLEVGLGQVLAPNDPRQRIWFCPAKPLVIRCEVEQEFADRIEPGMKVKVTNESFDGREWTGHIQRCAPWVAPRRTLWNKVFEVSEVPTVECIVDLDPDQKPLRIGQRVRARLESTPRPEQQTASKKSTTQGT